MNTDTLPELCNEPGHVDGCPGRAGGDHIVLRMNAMRCVVCGHRLDDMGGCDACAADVEVAMVERLMYQGEDDAS